MLEPLEPEMKCSKCDNLMLQDQDGAWKCPLGCKSKEILKKVPCPQCGELDHPNHRCIEMGMEGL